MTPGNHGYEEVIHRAVNDRHYELMTKPEKSIDSMAKRENVNARFIRQRLQLALLSPMEVKTLIHNPHELTISLQKLKTLQISPTWSERRYNK